ncbi:hypothetical protein [Azospirillum sp. SYSU D00513]|uniref:hypothetical protein n=1 Tax=Azospirillum sp. SYSU D00513 TaxID=2812561 RepID=UPI001FFFC27B|nr:hypothetical protein [Azospirillum sp. SYSU D00513]
MRASVAGVCAFVVMAGAALAVSPAQAKEPAACQAISFRPLLPGAPDGVQDAGLKPTKSGRVEIKADVQGGNATNYFMTLKGNKVEAGTGGPKVSDGCLKAKNVALPYKTQTAGACTGERFRVVIERQGEKRVAQFFGLHGEAWEHCSSAVM